MPGGVGVRGSGACSLQLGACQVFFAAVSGDPNAVHSLKQRVDGPANVLRVGAPTPEPCRKKDRAKEGLILHVLKTV